MYTRDDTRDTTARARARSFVERGKRRGGREEGKKFRRIRMLANINGARVSTVRIKIALFESVREIPGDTPRNAALSSPFPSRRPPPSPSLSPRKAAVRVRRSS
jgi:hypothetical protein